MIPQISVVIPARPKDAFLNKVVHSVKMQKGLNYEILVVFNPYLPPWSQKGIKIYSSSEGANCARNVGLRNARSDLILFLDSDCELENDSCLLYRFNKMMQNPQWVAAGGNYAVSEAASPSAQAYNYIQNNWLYSNIQGRDLKIPFLLGGNMVIRKSLLRGLEFDEQMKYGGTEKEFFCRLQAINNNVHLVPDWTVLHLAEIDDEQLKIKAHAQGLGSKYIEQKGVSFTPQKKNVFIEPVQKEYLKYVHMYREAYEKAYLGEEWLKKNSLKNKFKMAVTKLVEGIDITLQGLNGP